MKPSFKVVQDKHNKAYKAGWETLESSVEIIKQDVVAAIKAEYGFSEAKSSYIFENSRFYSARWIAESLNGVENTCEFVKNIPE